MASGRDNLARHVRRDREKRWRSRGEFAAHAGVGKRTVDRIERAEDHSYSERTKARIEAGLGWADGSFDRVAAGGRPTHVTDPLLAEVVEAWPRLSRDARAMLLRLVRDALERPS